MDDLFGFIVGAIMFFAVAYVVVILAVAVLAGVLWLAVGLVTSAVLVALPVAVLTLIAYRVASVDLRQAWFRLRRAELSWLGLFALLAFPAFFMAVKLDFVDSWPTYVTDDLSGIVALGWANLASLGVLGALLVYDVLIPYVRYRQALQGTPDMARRHALAGGAIDLDAIAEDAPSLRLFGRTRPEMTRAFKTRLNGAAKTLRIPIQMEVAEPTYATKEARDLKEATEVTRAYGDYARAAGERELERQTEERLQELRKQSPSNRT